MTANTPARSATAVAVPARPWLAVTREVAGDRVNRIVFAAEPPRRSWPRWRW